MTRDEIVSFITNKSGMTDSSAVARCNEFVQRRFELIYDQDNWRDTIKLVAGLTVDTTGVMAMPANIQRVIAIRATGDHILTPADSSFLMQFDPTIFERSGDPLAFEEFTDSTAVYARKIRLWPIPTANKAILLCGKMSVPTLAGADSPSTYIRSIDNCLIAYSEGDMLQHMRQFGKSNIKYQEAAGLLETMRKIENQQGARQWVVLPDVEPEYDPMGSGSWSVTKATF